MDINSIYEKYNNLLDSEKYISKKTYDELQYEFSNLSLESINNEKNRKIKKFINIMLSDGYKLVDKHNQDYLDKMYKKYKDYFDNMYVGIDDNIKLDEEQAKAILADEDYALIIAGAGTGKTTTMTSKVKFLVDIKKVDPSKILVMSYTKKATMELEERIVDKFNIPCCTTTFHSLGYKYLKKIFPDKKCIVIDENDKNQIFLEYFKSLFLDKSKIRELIRLFPNIYGKQWYFSRFFVDNYDLYNTYDEFFEAYKKIKISEAKNMYKDIGADNYENMGLEEIINRYLDAYFNGESIKTIKGERVRSVAEAKIANFLFTHGIDYSYEKVYEEVMDDNSIYRPDFTLELGGQEIYLEYFGLNDYRYNIIRKRKEEYHRKHANRFISLNRVSLSHLEEKLDNELIKMGFTYKIKTNEEIYNQLLDNTPLSQLYPFKDFIYNCIDCVKDSLNREYYLEIVKDYFQGINPDIKIMAEREFHYINEFFNFYQKSLFSPQEFKCDYSDLLYYSCKYIDEMANNDGMEFDYIIIDEYQDISKKRYDLAKKTADRNNSKVFAVGDDWQSIYAFSGSRIDYIYNFDQYFKSSKVFKITTTYRNSQELINITGKFIMKNKNQIPKRLISRKHALDPIKFVDFDSESDLSDDEYLGKKFRGYQEYKCLEDLILKIHDEFPEHNILVLGRTNKIIDRCFYNENFKDDLGTKITFVGYEDINLDAMTMHKSKGLTFDEVIILGMNDRFPIDGIDNYWLVNLFRNPLLSEPISDAEERRLFYVALTRTKNNVYLLRDKNPKRRSKFLDEIGKIIDEQKNR